MVAPLGLALLALILRVWGINFGLPAIYRPDEDVVVGRAMGVLHGDFDPQFANWPHLYFYVSAGWLGLLRPFFSLLGPAAPYLVVRLLGALLGTATVLLLYALGRRAYGRTAGLIGGLGLAVAFLHVRDSHFATLDVPLTFACVATLYFALRLAESGRLQSGLLAASWLGLAASVKYNGALTLAGIGAALGTRFAHTHRRLLQLAISMAGVAALGFVVFILTSPFLVIDFAIFRSSLGYIFRQLSSPALTEIGWVHLVRVAMWSGLGPPLFVLSLLGVAYAIVLRTRADWILVSFLLAYYGLIGFGHTVYVRYADPLLPVLALLAARALAELARSFHRSGLALVIGAGLVVVPALSHDVSFDSLISKTDTRTQAFDWLQKNVPVGARIADLYVAGPSHDQAMIDSRKHSVGARDPYVGAFLQNRLQGRYTVHDLTEGEIESDSLQELRSDGVSYVVFSSPRPDAGCSPPPPLGKALEATAALLATFLPARGCSDSVFDPIDAYYVPLSGYEGWLRPGPAIRIYRIQ